LVTFKDADEQNLVVRFTNPETGSYADALVERVLHLGDIVNMRIRSPPFAEEGGNVQVSFEVLGEVMETNPSSVIFTYRTEYLSSVLPIAALNVGGTQLRLVVIGLKPEKTYTNVQAQVAGQSLTGLSVDFSGNQFVVEGTVPDLSSLTGKVSVQVTFNDGDGLQTLTRDNVLSLYTMPGLQLVETSVVVNGASPEDMVVYINTPVVVEFDLKFVGTGDRVSVQIGGRDATSVTSRLFEQADVRQNLAIIECFTPTGLQPGSYPLVVTTRSDRFGTRTTTSQQLITFRNLAAPSILETLPARGRMSGGAVVVASVLSMCPSSCPPPSPSVTFDGQAATVLGVITLQSWKAGLADAAYERLVSSTAMSEAFATISEERRQQFDLAAQRLEAVIQGTSATPANVFLVFFRAPPAQQPTGATRQTEVVVSSGTMRATIPYTLLANPIGPAVVERAIPSSGSIAGGRRVSVSISNFLTVHTSSDLSIDVGGMLVNMETLSILSSTDVGTELAFVMPPMDRAGKRLVNIQPTLLPSNIAFFEFNYLSDRDVEVLSVFPGQIYTRGGETVTAEIREFGFQGMQASDLEVTFTDAAKSIRLTDFSVTYVAASETTVFTFSAPGSAAGQALVSLQMSSSSAAAGEIAEFSLRYVPVPAGDPKMACVPSTGSMSG